MKDFQEFLALSEIARVVELEPAVVLQRTTKSPREVEEIGRSAAYGPVPQQHRVCELEAGGQVVARGHIIIKHGKAYFKVTQLGESEE